MKIKRYNRFNTLKSTGIRKYQFLVFFVILTLLLGSSIVNLQTFTNTTNKLNSALTLNAQLIRVISSIETTYNALVIDLQHFIYGKDETALSSMYTNLASMKNLEQQANYYLSEIKQNNTATDPIATEIRQHLSELDLFIDMIVLLQLDGMHQKAQESFVSFETSELLELKVELNDYIKAQQQVIAKVIQESKATKSNMFYVLILQNGIVWLLFFVLAYFLEQTISKPLIAISNQFKSISSGDMDSVIGVDINTDILEIEALTKAANNMRLRLQESFNEAKSYSASLELRVYERTLELEESYKSLQLAMQDLNTSQEKLMSFRKQEILNQFISSLLHRVNTPLGTAVLSTDLMKTTLTSMQQGQSSPSSLESLIDCIDMIITSHKRIIDTMANLNTLLEIDHHEIYELIDVPALISESIMNLSMKNNQLTDLFYTCPNDLKAYLQKNNFRSLLVNVFEYILLSNTHPAQQNKSLLMISLDDVFLLLDIHNPIIRFDEMPSDLMSYLFRHMGIGEDLNLELATIISTAANGMNGTVSLLRTESDQTILRIKIPVQKTPKGD